MSAVDLAALRALAERATPGDWLSGTCDVAAYIKTREQIGTATYLARVDWWSTAPHPAPARAESLANAAYIAAAHPAAVLSIIEAAERVPALEAALKKAEQFIVNGTEAGYIRMPEMLADTAHETLPAIRAALEPRS